MNRKFISAIGAVVLAGVALPAIAADNRGLKTAPEKKRVFGVL